MRRWYISEMDARAAALARRYGVGLESIAFCAAENMENAALVREKSEAYRAFSPLMLHAPYYELAPCAIDPLARALAERRFAQAAALCGRLGAGGMVVHSGFLPQVYYPEWFLPRSIEFWREFLAAHSDAPPLYLENVLDPRPETLRALADGVDDERLRLCLDVGHANVYSEVPVLEWIEALGARIGHVHLHNNDGRTDRHAALPHGEMDIEAILARLERCAPEASVTIESMDAAASAAYLAERGILPWNKH